MNYKIMYTLIVCVNLQDEKENISIHGKEIQTKREIDN